MGIEEIILEETRKAGKLEGKLEGREEGKLEEKTRAAHKSWKMGLSAKVTAELTALPLERVEDLFENFAAKTRKD